jgi:uncharacterized membrane protein
MNVDPVDDCTFWYVNEYLPVTSSVGWRLRIGAFKFDECGETLPYNVNLSADQNATGMPGDTVEYDLTLTNTGLNPDTYDLTLSGETWPTLISDDTVSLAPGESTIITVAVTIPDDAMGGDSDTATVTATSQTDPGVSDSADLTTSVDVVYGVELSADQSAEGMPGEIVTYTISLLNTGTVEDTYELTVSDNDWPTILSEDTVTLLPGENADVTVAVEVPADAMGGDSDIATVTATSTGDPGGASDSLTLTTSAAAVYGVQLSADQSGGGAPGQDITFTITLTNTGNVEDTFELSISGNDWDTALSEDSVTLAPGESADVVVTVTIPADAAGGDADTATITVTSTGDPSVSDSVTITTTAVQLRLFLPINIRQE